MATVAEWFLRALALHGCDAVFLGCGLGAALGAPDRLVVTVVGDGSFIFGVPSAALRVSARHRLPVLIVVLNNERYNSVVLASEQAYPDGAQARFGHVGSLLPDTPAFERIAEACGAWGRRVTDRAELRAALGEAVSVVLGGTSAVLNVMTEASRKPL